MRQEQQQKQQLSLQVQSSVKQQYPGSNIYSYSTMLDHPIDTIIEPLLVGSSEISQDVASSASTFRDEEVIEERIETYDDDTSSLSFIRTFLSTKGPPQIIIICICIAVGFGCTIGIVPNTMTTQYARIYYNYTSSVDCNSLTTSDKARLLDKDIYHNTSFYEQERNYYACHDGNAMAQSAVAIEQFVSNLCTFFASTYIGSMSDMYGRKPIMTLGIFINSLSTIILLLIQTNRFTIIDPFYYYSISALSGCVPWMGVALSSISDVVPKHWRAPSYGLVIVGFSFGFAIAPQIAIIHGVSHATVTVISIVAIYIGLFILIFSVPETLDPINALHAQQVRTEHQRQLWNEYNKNNSSNNSVLTACIHRIFYGTIYRPLWEITILNRNTLFRLLSCLAFFSGMVSSGDRTLLIYYIQEHVQFNDHDIATTFLIMGLFGIFIQSVVLKVFNDLFGERIVVIISFCFGIVHNVLYSIASTKQMIFISVAIGTFVGMSFPTISAIKSNNVEASEQGRIQGALYSLSALASAFGPVAMRFVYQYTKDSTLPGAMFLFAAILYTIATYCAYLLPVDADSREHITSNIENLTTDIMADESNDNETCNNIIRISSFDLSTEAVTVETPLLQKDRATL